jgi:hypothetical protein
MYLKHLFPVILGFFYGFGALAADTNVVLGDCRSDGPNYLNGTTGFECESRGGKFAFCGMHLPQGDLPQLMWPGKTTKPFTKPSGLQIVSATYLPDGVRPAVSTYYNSPKTLSTETLFNAAQCGITTGYSQDKPRATAAFQQIFGNRATPQFNPNCTVSYGIRVDAPKSEEKKYSWNPLPIQRSTAYCRPELNWYHLSPRVDKVTIPNFLEVIEPKTQTAKLMLSGCSFGDNPLTTSLLPICTSAIRKTIQANGTVKVEEFNDLAIELPEVECSKEFEYNTVYSHANCYEKSARSDSNLYETVNAQISTTTHK